MIYGQDYLGGAAFQSVILKYHPKGMAAGFFAHTFGNAFPTIKALIKTGNCPLVRVHSIWADNHAYKDSFLPQIKEDCKKLCNIAKNNPKLTFHFSPMCEHTMKKDKMMSIINECRKIKNNIGCKNLSFVNCVWTGEFIYGESDIYNEIHGTHALPNKGKFNFSYDGLSALNSDVEAFKKKYGKAEVFFLWDVYYNLKKDGKEKITVAERLARSYRPKQVHVEAIAALAKPKRDTYVPNTMIIKPMSEECCDFKSNKLLLLLPEKSNSVTLIRNNAKQNEIEKLSRFDPPVDKLYRYYANKAGYEYVKTRAIKIKIDGVIKKSNGKEVYFNPAFRGGTYK